MVRIDPAMYTMYCVKLMSPYDAFRFIHNIGWPTNKYTPEDVFLAHWNSIVRNHLK